MNDELNRIVRAAQQGNRDALEAVVRQVQDRVHHLAMRILVNPEDALEATQEILIMVVTKLSSYEGKSAFQTWVFRVAVNYLLSAKKRLNRNPERSFETFLEDLHSGLAPGAAPSAEDQVMLNELRISCTMAMILCLDLEHRLAYVLGDILEFDHTEAAEVLAISKANFRKRLSRARAQVVAFTTLNCGLANDEAKCSCPRRLPAAIQMGRLQPDCVSYAIGDAPDYEDALNRARAVEGALRTLALQRSTPQFNSPEDFGAKVARVFDSSV